MKINATLFLVIALVISGISTNIAGQEQGTMSDRSALAAVDSISVTTSSPQYYLGDTVEIVAYVTSSGSPVSGSSVTFEVRNPSSDLVVVWVSPSNGTGYAVFSFLLADDAVNGTYTVFVSSGQPAVTASTSFQVLKQVFPVITGPSNMTVELGTLVSLNWTVTDEDPDSFEVYVNGTLQLSGKWTSGAPVVFTTTFDEVGVLVIDFIVTDLFGHQSSWSITVTIVDTKVDVLSVDHPDTVVVDESFVISVHAEDPNPSTWSLSVDGTEVDSGDWTISDFNITTSISTYWEHFVLLEVTDSYGNTESVEFSVLVVDHGAPIVPDKQVVQAYYGLDVTLSWEVSDENPGEYLILLNGSIIDSGNWTNGTITYETTLGRIGTLVFQLQVSDVFGQTSTSEIIYQVSASEYDPPALIQVPKNQSVHIDEQTVLLSWTVEEDNPLYANFSVDNQLVEQREITATGTFDLTFLLNFTEVRDYFVTMSIEDITGNIVSSTVLITVLPPLAELVPFVDSPSDVVIGYPYEEYYIVWHPTDPNPLSYSILIDGRYYMDSVSWDGGDVRMKVNEFDPGTYRVSIIVTNQGGYSAVDEVWVTILPVPDTGSSNTAGLPLYFQSILVALTLTVVWRRRYGGVKR